MISFDNFKIEADSPIFSQIIQYIKRGIAAGEIRLRDELPSRRLLSARLGVNPNTIQRAYRQLEEEGIIQSHSGAKSYVKTDEKQAEKIRLELLENDAKRIVRDMKQMGVPKAEALELVSRLWEKD